MSSAAAATDTIRLLQRQLLKAHDNLHHPHADRRDILATVKDCLLRLGDSNIDMTRELLAETGIAKTVVKFQKLHSSSNSSSNSDDNDDSQAEIASIAKRLRRRWKQAAQFESLHATLHTISKKLKNSTNLTREDRNKKYTQAADALKQLNEMPMTLKILRRTKIGADVYRIAQHSGGEARDLASRLVEKWSRIASQCTGRAFQALELYRNRERALKQEGRSKPDMIAFSELRQRWTPPRRHGKLPNVPIGIRVGGRGEAAILGIHQKILAGIDSLKDEPCYAVCMAGKYDDNDDADEDGPIIYTGSGGQKGQKQVEDQTENVDNQSLIRSKATGKPIRMLRRRARGDGVLEYCYDGLYRCTDFTYERSVDGPKVYKFVLEPIPDESQKSVRVRKV